MGFKEIHPISLPESFVSIAVFAITTHLYLRSREVAPNQVSFVVLLLVVIPIVSSFLLLPHFSSALYGLFLAHTTFHGTLLLSVILYRISPLHPLAKYPGPHIARITKLWGVYHSFRAKSHILHKALHDKYGPYVRIGPNELSVVDIDALSAVLGSEGMPKGPNADARRPTKGPPSIILLRDVEEHRRRRRTWNRAFTSASVKEYESAIAKRSLQLAESLEAQSDPIDLARWLMLFSFDFMGDLLFGGGFDLMRDGDNGNFLGMIHKATVDLSIMQHIPWAAQFLRRIPSASEGIKHFREFAMHCFMQRKDKGASTKDVFHHIMDEDELEPERPSLPIVMSDSALAVIAGSDTTSTALSGLFYFLLSHPAAYSRLREEIDVTFPDNESPFDSSKLAGMPYLNAVINETLRLQPPVSVALQRSPAPGSGGKQIGGHFIQEGTAITIPPYALHRDSRYFSPTPDEFVPERWLSRGFEDEGGGHIGHTESHLVFNTNPLAFIPFSMGPSNCVGKNLAIVEMRMVVALLVQRFEMRFSDDYDPTKWEAELQDRIVTKTGPLPVMLSRR